MQAVEIKGVHFDIDDSLYKYVTKKLGGLEKYISKHCQECAHLQIWLKESRSRNKKSCTCEVTMHLPNDTIHISESTLNMYAAVDIVQAKLKQQITKYRELHTDGRHARRLFTRLMRHTA